MEFARVSPESLGIPSPAIEGMLDQLDREGIEMHSFLLLRHGQVAAEGYWRPYAPGVQHSMFSFSKSLTSTAIGFAVQEGLLSLDDRLIDIFPDKAPKHPSEHLRACTVRHLLMMGCGHESEIAWGAHGDPDWIREFLHHAFPYAPGTHFLYNTPGANLLCAILAKKTGQQLTAFLRPRLLEPLGLSVIQCQPMADGTEMGGAGFALTLEDMARFTQFVANRGRWEGRQLLSAEWFDQATAKQIENRGAGWGGDPDWQQGYGFQFWRCAPEGVFRGDGAFGQYGVVMTKQDAVLVIQSASMKLQAVLTAAWENLLPAMAEDSLPEDGHALAHLRERLAHLELHTVLGMRNPGAEQSLNGAAFLPDTPIPAFADLIGGAGRFMPEGGSLVSLGFRFTPEEGYLQVRQENGFYELPMGLQSHFALGEIAGAPYGANGRWRAKDKLEVDFRGTRYVSGKRFVFRFEHDRLFLTADSTVPEIGGLNDPACPEYSLSLAGGEVQTKTHMYYEN